MFKLRENYEVDRRILKCDYIRYSPAETSTIDIPNSLIYINIPREDSVISLLNSYLDLNFEVVKRADKSRYANGNDIRLVNLGPIALFSNFKLTTSSGNYLEDINHAHLVSLMYKLITSSKDSNDISIGFDYSRNRRKEKLTNNKNVKGKYHPEILLIDVFGFAECQQKATYGLGYNLFLTKTKDDAVIDKAGGIADAKIRIDHNHWYVPRYTPSIHKITILSNQILKEVPTELRYIERSDFMKEVNNQNLWKFELGSQENMNVHIWILIGFQQRNRQDSQSLKNDNFCRLPVVSAQCIIGTEKDPDVVISLNYDDDDYSQGYDQIKVVLRTLRKNDILQPYISDDNIRFSNVRADNDGYNLYVFDIRYQKNFTNSQQIKVNFKFDGVVPNDINCYGPVLTNKIVSISSDGQRHFDLI